MSLDAKPGLRETLVMEVQYILDAGVCSSGQAAKLWGKLAWAASAVFGECARGGQRVLIQRQYAESASLTVPA